MRSCVVCSGYFVCTNVKISITAKQRQQQWYSYKIKLLLLFLFCLKPKLFHERMRPNVLMPINETVIKHCNSTTLSELCDKKKDNHT